MSVEATTEPSSSTPPMVGVPALLPCNSASLWTCSFVRIGWPTFKLINRRITQFPNINDRRNAVTAAPMERNVM